MTGVQTCALPILIKLLRHVNIIVNTKEEDVLAIIFGKIENDSKKFDALSGRSLDKLIREDLITNAMATSLMNDTAYANSIANGVKQIAHILFMQQKIHKNVKETIKSS